MKVELDCKVLGTALSLGIMREADVKVGRVQDSEYLALQQNYEKMIVDAVVKAAHEAIYGKGGAHGN